MNKSLIAPCGMNCALCVAFQRVKNKCPGCRAEDTNKAKSCVNCKIKNCENFKINKAKFCYECDKFPCDNLKHLDKRYRTKYHMSMIDNLTMIKNKGLNAFLIDQKAKWTCPNCGGAICVHKNGCVFCVKGS